MCDSGWSSGELGGQRPNEWEGDVYAQSKKSGVTLSIAEHCHCWPSQPFHLLVLCNDCQSAVFLIVSGFLLSPFLSPLWFGHNLHCCVTFYEPWYSAYALCLCSCSAAARTVANNPFTFLKGGRFSHVVLPLLKHLCLTKINYCLLRSPLSLLLLTSSLIFIFSLPRRKKKLWFLVFRFSKLYSKGSAVINIASFGFDVPKSLWDLEGKELQKGKGLS